MTRLGITSILFGVGLPIAGAAQEPEPPAPNDSGVPSLELRANPLSSRGIRGGSPITKEEANELARLEGLVRRFEDYAAEYREHTKKLIEDKYQDRKNSVFEQYERIIEELESSQRSRRSDAIARFEAFLKRYPDQPGYTPDAMFRLAELYFERSYDEYFQAQRVYEDALAKFDPDQGGLEPEEPTFHYESTIAMMQRLITDFADYRLADGAFYLLGYCLAEQGEEERSVDVYEELVARFPESRFKSEVWTRVGEYYFSANELERAMQAYVNVLGDQDSPFYDKAMYKLAWTHYRLADPETAPEEFQKAVDTFVELLDFNISSKEAGRERGAELRDEAIQYIAISYSEEEWGGLAKVSEYLRGRGPHPYDRDILVALGEVFFDQTRFGEAVAVFDEVQATYPEHPEAPEIQQQIIQAHERDRNFEDAARARTEMLARYVEGSQWYEANKEDSEAINRAFELSKDSVYTAALFHHRQAQIHREAQKTDLAKEEYQTAASLYARYLKRFPHDKQLYELTFYEAECLYYSLQFEPAAQKYAWVRDAKGDDKFLQDSALSSVLALENAIKLYEARGELEAVEVLRSSDRDSEAGIVPKEIPDLKQRMVDASDRYALLVPEGENTPNVMYRAAEVFYTYDQFPEARARFQVLLERFPGSEVAEFASNLTIESFLAEGRFEDVEAFSKQMLARTSADGAEGSSGRGFRDNLVKFRTGALFKIAEDAASKGEYERSAELYVALLAEHPKNEFADSALNNAAVAYEQVKRYESASRLYERLVSEHPKSPLADGALFRVGLNAERFFDFPKAIKTYRKVVKNYPKSDRRADAIFNAALALENTQNYEAAAKQYLRYCELFPKREDAPEVCFRAGSVYEKMKEPRRVISTFQDFRKRYKRNKMHRDRLLEANLRIGQAYAKLRDQKKAMKSFKQVVRAYEKEPDKKSGPFAAEARFRVVEQSFAEFRKIQLVGKSKKQKKILSKKAKRLKAVENEYKSILKFKQIDWTLASLFRIGQLYQSFAQSLIDAQCPPDVKKAARKLGASPEEVCDEYSILLEEKAAGIEDKAVQAYETTVTKARELQVANKWTKKTLVALNALRRAEWPLQKDAEFHIATEVVVPPPLVDADKNTLRDAQEPAREENPAPSQPVDGEGAAT